MIITIDTNRDSHLDIRKAIRMLMSLVGETPVRSNEPVQDSRNIFENPPSEGGSVLGSLFGDDNKGTQPIIQEEEPGQKFDLEVY